MVFMLLVGIAWVLYAAWNWKRLGWKGGRLWGLVAGGFMALGALGNLGGGTKKDMPASAPVAVAAAASSSTAPAPKPSPAPAPAPKPAPKAAPSPAKIGDTVTVTPWQYQVAAVSTATSVGDVADGLGDTANGVYVLVTVKVGDVGSKAGTLDASMMQLADAQGHTYSYDISATSDVNPPGKDLFLQTVNPGVSDTAQIAYDVPKGLAPSTLSLAVTNGILATKTAYIALQK